MVRRGALSIYACDSDGFRASSIQLQLKLAASLLGIAALVAASTAVSLVDLDAPWNLALYFGVMAIVLLGGTLWLVPSSRAKQMRRTIGTADPR